MALLSTFDAFQALYGITPNNRGNSPVTAVFFSASRYNLYPGGSSYGECALVIDKAHWKDVSVALKTAGFFGFSRLNADLDEVSCRVQEIQEAQASGSIKFNIRRAMQAFTDERLGGALPFRGEWTYAEQYLPPNPWLVYIFSSYAANLPFADTRGKADFHSPVAALNRVNQMGWLSAGIPAALDAFNAAARPGRQVRPCVFDPVPVLNSSEPAPAERIKHVGAFAGLAA